MASGVDQGWATGRQVRKDSHLMKERVSLEGGGFLLPTWSRGARPWCKAHKSQADHSHLVAAEG